MSGDADKVWKMAKDMDICMLVTYAERGLHSRPMSSVVDKEAGKIRFLADKGAGKDDEIKANSDVLLAYSNGSNTHVSIKGKATLTADRALIKKIWSPGAQAFFPDGPESPKVICIEVTPTGAEYWDGDNAVVAAVKFAAALATGSETEPGTSAKTRL